MTKPTTELSLQCYSDQIFIFVLSPLLKKIRIEKLCRKILMQYLIYFLSYTHILIV